MEQVLEHLLADRKKAEQEERKFWEKLFEDKIFKEAMYTDSRNQVVSATLLKVF